MPVLCRTELATAEVTHFVIAGKDLTQILKDNMEEIGEKILEITGTDIGAKGPNALQNFYDVYHMFVLQQVQPERHDIQD